MSVRVRFAPSPTGFPHVGNIRTALFDWLLARNMGGTFILRVEDTDRSREVEGAREGIKEALRWLGMDWDEGPDVGGPFAPYNQSERLSIYQPLYQQLLAQGDAYKCFCTSERLAGLRKSQEEAKKPTMYDRHCRQLSDAPEGQPFVIRLKMPLEGKTVLHDYLRGDVEFDNALVDDPVLIKSDGFPTYHFAAMVDDHLMEITHVIRAEEWISSAPKHIRLYEAFGWQQPIWVHPSIILGPDRKRLSKRHGATEALAFRDEGVLPDALVNFLALCGWSPGDDREVMTRRELIEAFSLDGIQVSPAIFDHEKLKWMNGVYIRQMPLPVFGAACRPYLGEVDAPDEYIEAVVALEQERVRTLSEIKEATSFFFDEAFEYDEKGVEKWFRQGDPRPILEAMVRRLAAQEHWSADGLAPIADAVAEELGLEKRAPVIHTARVAISGRTGGPGLFDMMTVMGKDRVLRRIHRTLETHSASAP